MSKQENTVEVSVGLCTNGGKHDGKLFFYDTHPKPDGSNGRFGRFLFKEELEKYKVDDTAYIVRPKSWNKPEKPQEEKVVVTNQDLMQTIQEIKADVIKLHNKIDEDLFCEEMIDDDFIEDDSTTEELEPVKVKKERKGPLKKKIMDVFPKEGKKEGEADIEVKKKRKRVTKKKDENEVTKKQKTK